MTAELATTWSLPGPMVDAYQYRAFPESACGHRLGLVVGAGVAAVKSAEAGNGPASELTRWADALGIPVDDLHEMAVFNDRQKERVQSVASNMTG